MLELEQSARRAAGGAETKLLIALPRPLRPGSDVIVHGSLLGSRVSATLLSTQDTGSLRVELTDALDDVTNPAAVFEAAHRGPGGRLLAMERGSWVGIGRRAHGVESVGHSLQQVQEVSQCGFSLRFGIGETCYEICIRSDASVNESQLARFLHRHTFKNFTRLLLSGAADFREIECRDEDASLYYKLFSEPFSSQPDAWGEQSLWRCRLSLPRVEHPLQTQAADCSAESQLTLQMSVGLNDKDFLAAANQQLLLKVKVNIEGVDGDDVGDSQPAVAADTLVPMAAPPTGDCNSGADQLCKATLTRAEPSGVKPPAENYSTLAGQSGDEFHPQVQSLDESLILSHAERCDASLSSDLLSPPPLTDEPGDPSQQHQQLLQPVKLAELNETPKANDSSLSIEQLASPREPELQDSKKDNVSKLQQSPDSRQPAPQLLPPLRRSRRTAPTISPFVCRAERAATPESVDLSGATKENTSSDIEEERWTLGDQEHQLMAVESYLSTAVHPRYYSDSLAADRPETDGNREGAQFASLSIELPDFNSDGNGASSEILDDVLAKRRDHKRPDSEDECLLAQATPPSEHQEASSTQRIIPKEDLRAICLLADTLVDEALLKAFRRQEQQTGEIDEVQSNQLPAEAVSGQESPALVSEYRQQELKAVKLQHREVPGELHSQTEPHEKDADTTEHQDSVLSVELNAPPEEDHKESLAALSYMDEEPAEANEDQFAPAAYQPSGMSLNLEGPAEIPDKDSAPDKKGAPISELEPPAEKSEAELHVQDSLLSVELNAPAAGFNEKPLEVLSRADQQSKIKDNEDKPTPVAHQSSALSLELEPPPDIRDDEVTPREHLSSEFEPHAKAETEKLIPAKKPQWRLEPPFKTSKNELEEAEHQDIALSVELDPPTAERTHTESLAAMGYQQIIEKDKNEEPNEVTEDMLEPVAQQTSGISSELGPPPEIRDEDLAPVTHQASGLSSDLRPTSETKDEDLAPVTHQTSGMSSDLRPPSETRDEDLAPVTHQASGLSSDLRPPSETKDEDLAPVAHHVGGVEQGLNPPSGSADTQDELSALSLELEPAHENRTDALGAMFHKQSESSPETGGQTQSHEEELTTEPVKHEYTAMSPHSAEHREQALKAKQLQRIDNSLNSDRPENSSPSSEVSESSADELRPDLLRDSNQPPTNRKHAKHPSEQRGGAATPPVMANFACHVERGNSCASSVRSRSDTDEAGADAAATNSPRISKFSCRVYRNGELVEANHISEAPPADGAAARSSVCSSASTAEEREEWDEFNGRTVSVTRISQPMPECPQSWSSTRRERRPRRSHPVCQVGVTDGNQVNVAWLPSLRRGHGGQQVVKDAELDVVRQTLKAPFLSSVGLEMSDRGCDVVVKQTYPTVSAGIRACSGADHPSV